ncbi:MAG: Uma2 family endonuclease [Longimonas sp.]|uniref:Uma2 family endonuclease n=1 Tax=Longimonas sp. TaxID=2039626 RepID=UPI00335C36BE
MPSPASPQIQGSDRTPLSHGYRFSRAQYERMVETGVLGPSDRVELIDGQIVPMGPQNSRHTITVERVRRVLDSCCPSEAYVRTQYPLALGDGSEPEPDVAVVPGTLDDHLDAHPSEALLVVEVADTSLAFDQDTKRRLYAQHGIPAYWIVNLPSGCVEVYTHPSDGDYTAKHTVSRNERLSVPFADAVIACTDILSA